jgi:pimeloyl-ACP methyl ester carboxylesterase
MLGYIFSARYPDYVKKLIMVGSAVFEEKYAAEIEETRLSRLKSAEKKEVFSLFESLDDPAYRDKDSVMTRIGDLFTRTDAYKPLTLDTGVLKCQYDLFNKVWNEARELRISGQLRNLGKQIRCPVAIIHGDYDPHPLEGVLEPLSNILDDFHFYLLRNCGHLPWIEEEARDKFYAVLDEELD